MKYYLAFDMGSIRINSDRYVRIPNDTIHQDLDKSGNLKAICTFTRQFDNEQELKDTLIKLNPKLAIYKYYNLTIVWNRKYKGREYVRSNKVPYKSDSEYFNFENLVRTIAGNAYEPFFRQFLDSYRNCKYLEQELCNLYAAVMEYKPGYIIEDAVRSLLNKELYGKNGISFSKLYKMAMLVSKLLEYKIKVQNKEQESALVESLLVSNLSEVEEFELEWLEHRARLREKNYGYY